MMLLVNLPFVSRRPNFTDGKARGPAGKRAVDGKCRGVKRLRI